MKLDNDQKAEFAFWVMLALMLVVILIVTSCGVAGDIAPDTTLEPFTELETTDD